MPANWVVTATATSPANNTSEFSAWVPVVSVPLLQLAFSRINQSQISLSWTNNGESFGLQQSSLYYTVQSTDKAKNSWNMLSYLGEMLAPSVVVFPDEKVNEIEKIISRVENLTKKTRNKKIHLALRNQTKNSFSAMVKALRLGRK